MVNAVQNGLQFEQFFGAICNQTCSVRGGEPLFMSQLSRTGYNGSKTSQQMVVSVHTSLLEKNMQKIENLMNIC